MNSPRQPEKEPIAKPPSSTKHYINRMIKITSRKKGFTLVEIMIVVAIIALLASIAVPNFMRARKRSQATRMLEDLRIIDAALDQYAIEHNRSPGSSAGFGDLQPYIKNGIALYNSAGLDLYNNQYNENAIFTVDGIPKVNSATFNLLSDVAPGEFWSPFR